MQTTRPFATLITAAVLGAITLLTGCTNMPMNKPSALSPAQHSTAEAP
ncbi:MAG TPA: hypothetical protein VK477_11060 [Acidobacteriota bacterium]|nr:hypothetical protein [Acidobacteriota bacterium]